MNLIQKLDQAKICKTDTTWARKFKETYLLTGKDDWDRNTANYNFTVERFKLLVPASSGFSLETDAFNDIILCQNEIQLNWNYIYRVVKELSEIIRIKISIPLPGSDGKTGWKTRQSFADYCEEDNMLRVKYISGQSESEFDEDGFGGGQMEDVYTSFLITEDGEIKRHWTV